jgi:teichuronic acid biosynthesis glycosyltransferase TuaG
VTILTCVDVVVPFCNGNEFINEALKSIFDNDYVSRIFIIVDLNSSSPIIDSRYESSKKLQIIYNDKKIGGAGVVRSIGYNYASAEFVAFLDCDDVWSPDKLRIQIEHMRSNDLAFCFHGFSHFIDKNKIIYAPVIPTGCFNKKNFYRKNFTIGCLSVVVNKHMIGELPLITLKRRNDYYLWHFVIERCESKSLSWGGIPTILGFHRITNNSLSSSKIKSVIYYYKFLKLCRLSVFTRIICWIHYLLNTLGTR